jgi:hypothetical protein
LSRLAILDAAGEIYARQWAVFTAQPHLSAVLGDSKSNPDCEISRPFSEVEITKKIGELRELPRYSPA